MKSFPLFIAYRYFKAKKNLNAVNIIVVFSIIAITFSTAAMIIFLSIFSGLQNFNIKFISDVYSEIKISPEKGKFIPNIQTVVETLNKNPNINYYSKEIEEKVYISYRERSEVAVLKAVDSNYTKVYPLDTTLVAGSYLTYKYPHEMIMGNGLSFRLNIPISDAEQATIYMPKPGKGRINNIEESFSKSFAHLKAIFYINEQYNNTIFTPFSFGKKLTHTNSATAIHLKLKNPKQKNQIKNQLIPLLGNSIKVETREDQDAAFLQMMNIEKLIIYLILTLVIILTSFNLAGAVVVIILDKKIQTKALQSMGLENAEIKKSFLYTGMIMVAFGIILGLTLGSIILLLQQKYKWVKASQLFAFPVDFQFSNYLIVIITVSVIGLFVSYLASRKLYN